ncbi:hypothetical protein JXO59_12370 [candidate division KSB1 bacterium]|nr:hypothetical protein [candidate division KSB1 bacterium]
MITTVFRVLNNTVLLLIIFISLVYAAGWYRILETSEGGIVMEFDAPPIDMDSLLLDGRYRYTVHADDWPIIKTAGRYPVPFQNLILQLPVSKARATILKMEPANDLKIHLQVNEQDHALIPAAEEPDWEIRKPSDRESWPPAVLNYLGRHGDGYLWSLMIYPYHYDPSTHTLRCLRRMHLQVVVLPDEAGTEKPLLKKSRLNLYADLSLTSASTRGVNQANQTQMSNNDKTYCRIIIDRDGMYKINGTDLQAAGINLLAVEIKNLRLTCGGKDVPIYVQGWRDGQFHQHDYFEFWGEYNRGRYQSRSPDMYQDPFSATNVYWLSWQGAQGAWMSEEPSGIIDAQASDLQKPYSFYQTVHVEKDDFFDHLGSISQPDSLRDHWFARPILGAGRKMEFPFNIQYPDDRSSLPLQTRIMMCGLSARNEAPHQVSFFLNDRYLFTGQGFRQGNMDFRNGEEILLSSADLHHGENSLTVVNEFDPTQSDFVMMNWFEITYPRLYRADDEFIKFFVPPDYDLGRFLFRIDGFNEGDIDVYKLGTSKLTGFSIQEVIDYTGFQSLQVSFEDFVQTREVEYVAVSQSAKQKPIAIQVLHSLPTFAADAMADYIVITTSRFKSIESLQDLMSLRQSQGYRVSVVDIQDIFDVYDHGRRSSYALKSFLRWAYENWPLRYVLLVGDGCYLRKPVQGDTLDIIPVHYRQTLQYGATATDHWYSLLDGDDEIPDVHIGRLPVRNEEQLRAVVDKIIAHEMQSESGLWRNRLLFIGGEGQFFRDKGISLALKAPIEYSTALLFTTKDKNVPADPFYGDTSELLDYIDQGCAVINFHGHGGGAIWSDNGLLKLEDVHLMNNRNKYPLILSMTCYTGAFDDISERNLAEAMLFAEDRGTMMFVGTSGVGWRENDVLLQAELMDYFYDHPDCTIGEILDAAKVRYYAKYQSDIALSQVIQYNLFGDPATRMSVPDYKAELELSQHLIKVSDTLHVSTKLPFGQGSGVCELVDSTLQIVSQHFADVAQNRINFSMPILQTFPSSNGYVRVYANDNLGLAQAHGSAAFSLSDVLFDSVWVELTAQDSLFYRASILSRSPLQRVVCLAQGETLTMKMIGPNQYQSEKGQKLADQLTYRFEVTTAEGRIITSPNYIYNRPDQLRLEMHAGQWQWTGTDRLFLQAPIYNWGNGDGYALVCLEIQTATADWQLIGFDTVAVRPFSSAFSQIAFSAAPGRKRIRFGCKPLLMTEYPFTYSSSWIDVTAFSMPPSGGFRMGASIQDTLRFDEFCSLISAQGSGGEANVLTLNKSYPLSIEEQPDFHAFADMSAYSISFANNSIDMKGLELIFRINSTGSEADSAYLYAGIFRYVPQSRKWLRQATRFELPNLLITPLSEPGIYAALWARDTRPPGVEIIVDGRQHSPNNYVSPNPQVMVMLHDLNGVDVSPASLEIMLDGQRLPEIWVVPDSIINANEVVLQGIPSLQPGTHQMQVSAADCNGNVLPAKEIILKVAENFELRMLGNYPNPFKKETTFAYILTQPAERISLKIYTAAGKLIRKLDGALQEDANPLAADYHEITWDGNDEDGYKVANGVYFYKMTAHSGHKKQEVSGKMARLE